MIIKKISIELKPDTLQRTYLKMENIELEADVLVFNDGSVRVTVPKMDDTMEHRYCTINAFTENMNDLMVIAQVKDIIQRLSKSPKMFTLSLFDTAYTRYDRVMYENKTDAFGAKVFADLVNSLKFDVVNLFDCHSEIMLDLINNSVNISQTVLVETVLNDFDDYIDDYNIVAPDKGATKKLSYPNMIFDKIRNVETGSIEGMQIIHDDSSTMKDYIVIDDICEGGRTFIELAKLFKEKKPNETLLLYVTHGIFSNGAVSKLLEFYDKIYVKFMKETTFESLSDDEKSKVYVHELINT